MRRAAEFFLFADNFYLVFLPLLSFPVFRETNGVLSAHGLPPSFCGQFFNYIRAGVLPKTEIFLNNSQFPSNPIPY